MHEIFKVSGAGQNFGKGTNSLYQEMYRSANQNISSGIRKKRSSRNENNNQNISKDINCKKSSTYEVALSSAMIAKNICKSTMNIYSKNENNGVNTKPKKSGSTKMQQQQHITSTSRLGTRMGHISNNTANATIERMLAAKRKGSVKRGSNFSALLRK